MHRATKRSKEIERRLSVRDPDEADDQVGRRQSAGRGHHIKYVARTHSVHNPGDNNQFLKDIFQACMMQDVLHLAVAVRNTYRNSDDFAKVESFLETLYVSGRLQLPLKGILLIGY